MVEMPSDGWRNILIGHVLPSEQNLNTVNSASEHFGQIGKQFRASEHQLQSVMVIISSQSGDTANSGLHAFREGGQKAGEVAGRYEIIQACSSSSRSLAHQLRLNLLALAEQASALIKEVYQSREPTPVKIGKIANVVISTQAQASFQAATCASSMLGDIQEILDNCGVVISAQQFAKKHGVDTVHMFNSPNREAIHRQVSATLEKFGSTERTQKLDHQVLAPASPAPPVENQKSTLAGSTTSVTASVGSSLPTESSETIRGPALASNFHGDGVVA